MPTKYSTIDEYLASLPTDQRTALEDLRKTIQSAAPGAIECMNYGLFCFRLNGKNLVAMGAIPKHCGFYLMSNNTVDAHKDELKSYSTSTGTVRFQPDKPLPAELVQKLVRTRIAENGG